MSMLFQLWLHNISPSACNNGIQFMDRMCEATVTTVVAITMHAYTVFDTSSFYPGRQNFAPPSKFFDRESSASFISVGNFKAIYFR